MGALTPALGTLGTIGSVISTVDKIQSSQKAASLQRRQNQLNNEAYNKDRKDALKRAVAKQRARIGASGSTLSGSGEAILLGLFQESDEEIARRNSLDDLRNKALQQNEKGLYTRSLLNTSDAFSSLDNSSHSRFLS